MTENEPFNLAFKLDNTNSDSKAVYNVDTRAITITGSSGGQSFSFPFNVVDQTQTANGKIVGLQLVAVKPSSDPKGWCSLSRPRRSGRRLPSPENSERDRKSTDALLSCSRTRA